MDAKVVTIDKSRSLQRVIRGRHTSDGAGVNLVRLIGTPELEMLDPFLMLDAFSSDDPDDYIAGFPPHPHRGFETVTYLLKGNMRHRDSFGHEGVIRSGGVQWMSAASGIEHSEMPEQVEGEMSGFQLWVNLPAEQKMGPPRYQEFEPEQIPLETREGGIELRVIAGTTCHGTEGPVQAVAANPLYLDVQVPAQLGYWEELPAAHNAFIYVIDGVLEIDGHYLTRGELGVLDGGERVDLHAVEDARFLLVAASPVNEPVARSGPFVMNTEEELRQAYIDYREGRFGHIRPPTE